jgi:hypothetical protein
VKCETEKGEGRVGERGIVNGYYFVLKNNNKVNMTKHMSWIILEYPYSRILKDQSILLNL